MTVIESKVTVAKYRDEFLRDIILPFEHAHPAENFILVDDNSTSHCARVVTAYKQANNVIIEDWPARFPDLNVTEHTWGMLRRAVNEQLPVPNGLAELSLAVPRRVEQLGPERAEAAGAQRSKEVL